MYHVNNRIWFNFISKDKHHILGTMSGSDDFFLTISELTFALNPTYEFHQNTDEILSLMTNTPELRSRVSQYVEKYKKTSPSLNKLKTFVKSLEEDEKFYILPAIKDISQVKMIKLKSFLSLAHHEPSYIDEHLKSFNSFFSEFIENYSIDGVDPANLTRKKKIGEGLKNNRICRFCNNDGDSPTTFIKEAHAISESLGNKKIVLNEECDSCNECFDKTIERDMDTYLKLYSSFFRVKNKDNKVSKIKGKNFTFEFINDEIDGYDGHIDFILGHTSTNPDLDRSNSKPPEIVDLVFHQKIRNQNIYKSLVKFALSVIADRKDLTKFGETIKWIRSSTSFKDKLPKIAIMKNYNFFHKEPSLIVYKSIKNVPNLPYAIGEFHYTFLTYIFIIPLFDSKEVDFSLKENFDNFVEFLPQFKRIDFWDFEDFSDYKEKPFIINMKLSQNKSI